jgi:Zn-finger nucleic acid-binding protein
MEITLVEMFGHHLEIDRCSTCHGIWIDGNEREPLDHAEAPDAMVLRVPPRPDLGIDPRAFSPYRKDNSLALDVLIAFASHHPSPYERREPIQLIVFVLFAILLIAGVAFFLLPMLQLL